MLRARQAPLGACLFYQKINQGLHPAGFLAVLHKIQEQAGVGVPMALQHRAQAPRCQLIRHHGRDDATDPEPLFGGIDHGVGGIVIEHLAGLGQLNTAGAAGKLLIQSKSSGWKCMFGA
ncbi:hypothetical protein PU634_07785 [Oceanimonas pelagia]|uniref:Uncharacterized protein n=1 Tax=Oceanimonas pelagia TaxID=3028314 RepID=A0AA50QDJ9_9GAMM|nr:hypothetical protein [Oceanimonas pelagia]WMC12249.1 hypothetical protein PU634_07785 [Oceanimonas pelagia]